MDSSERIERYLILLLGIKEDSSIRELFLQKEMFLFSNFKEDLKEDLNFEKHYYGPYSQVIEEAILSPSHISKAFGCEGKRVFLTEEGKNEFKKMIEDNSDKNEFMKLLSGFELIRNIYDKLSGNELLFLIYETYPEYTKFSSVSDNLLKNKSTRAGIIRSLLSKGMITEKRYEELKNV